MTILSPEDILRISGYPHAPWPKVFVFYGNPHWVLCEYGKRPHWLKSNGGEVAPLSDSEVRSFLGNHWLAEVRRHEPA